MWQQPDGLGSALGSRLVHWRAEADGVGIPGIVLGTVATITAASTLAMATTMATAITTPSTRPQSITSIARTSIDRICTTSTPTVRTLGPTMRAHSEDRTRLVAWVIASVVTAAGHRGPTASAAGEACVPAVSAE